MCNVVRSNFAEKFPEIEANLRRAVFIAIDTELTGLLSSPEYKYSLFDSGKQRYAKLRQGISPFIIIQFGLSAFHFQRDKNTYRAYTYNFYLFPKSFSSIDLKFLWQTSSVEFLCQYNFDFNKVAYEGISYLNSVQEEMLRQELKERSLFKSLERPISQDAESVLQALCCRVSDWTTTAADGQSLVLELPEEVESYIVHHELRKRIPIIWTFQNDGHLLVKKMSVTLREQYDMQVDDQLEEELIQSLLGFTRVFRLLVELRKPIVGHNCLLDFMHMYQQFHAPLPKDYKTFKKNLMELFPHIYDTKFISFEVKKQLTVEELWESNSLSKLYHFMKEGKGSQIILYSPIIKHTEGFDRYLSEEMFHEAGCDAYSTGFVFIRLAHILAGQNYSKDRPLTSTEHITAVTPMRNCLNVIRGSISHMRLDGADPASQRPQWLHIQSRGRKSIDVSQVAETFSRFGSVDVKSWTRKKALVAVGNFYSARDILKHYKEHKDFHVCYYSPLQHSPAIRTVLWSGVVVSGGLCAWIAYSLWKGDYSS